MLGDYISVSYTDYHYYKNEDLWKIILRIRYALLAAS